jgi:hypothetical protein
MPVDVEFPVEHPEYPLVFCDDRRRDTVDGIAVGFNGLANLVFRGNTLEIEYRDIRHQLLLKELWETDDGVLRGKNIERGIADEGIKTPRDLNVAIGAEGRSARQGQSAG